MANIFIGGILRQQDIKTVLCSTQEYEKENRRQMSDVTEIGGNRKLSNKGKAQA